MPVFIERRHEAPVARRIADIRPFSERAAEWLSKPIHFALVAIAVALVPTLMAPILLPLSLLVYAAIAITYAVNRPLLPLRYPIFNQKLAPSGKKADGILMMGNVRSSSEYEHLKEIWLADDDLRKHCLIIGSTGSGKSETLKGILFNALCWSSGYFVADGKADNKMPTDNYTMVRSVGRDDDILVLNFLLGGRSPEQVAASRRRRSNGLNPFSAADADTIIQMGANLLPKAEGDGKAWQEKALNFWRAVVVALCYKRDTQGMEISIRTFIDYMALPKVEELYIEGYLEAQARGGQENWSYGFAAIKTYLESGCPAYKIDKLIARIRQDGGIRPRAEGQPHNKAFDQEAMAFEQHSYRTTQLMPVLNLLDKTYGHIFRDKFSEIDMVDVTLNNRILMMLIPSLEKSAQEAENLGKLAIACLRVMMGKNLGADIEGGHQELIESKATNAPYPYIVALDELAYYFSDGIAVMCAQARSLGFSMLALCQDLEKLTEGNRAAEAGAMMANQVTKYFMRIDDPKKTWELVQSIVGKAVVAVYRNFSKGALGWSRDLEVDLQEVDRVDLKELQGLGKGQGVLNSCGETMRMTSFYMGDELKENPVAHYHVNRFVQVRSPTADEIMSVGTALNQLADPTAIGERRVNILRYQTQVDHEVASDEVIDAMANLADRMAKGVAPLERGIALYMEARAAFLARKEALESQRPSASAASPEGADDVAQRANEGGDPSVPDMEPPKLRFPLVNPGAGRGQTGRRESSSEDDNANMLDFLNPGMPFQRKPVQELLPNDSAEHGSAFDADIQARMDQFSSRPDPVARIFFGGKAMTLGSADGAARVLDPSPTPSDVLHEQLSAATPFRAAAQQSEDWMVRAIDQSSEMLGEVASVNNDVVGFTPATSASVERIETALENPNPAAAAKALERVVATRITPPETLDDAGGIVDIDDVNAVFEAIDNGNLEA